MLFDTFTVHYSAVNLAFVLFADKFPEMEIDGLRKSKEQVLINNHTGMLC